MLTGWEAFNCCIMGESQSLIHEMDLLFAGYYTSKNRDDYFDAEHKGKFQIWCSSNNHLDNDDKLRASLDVLLVQTRPHIQQVSVNGFASKSWERMFGEFPCFTTPLHGHNTVNVYLQYCTVLLQLYQRRRVPSDDILIEFAMANKPRTAPLVHEMDQLFGQYYASKKRNDYFDGNHMGKFQFWCEASNLNDDEKLKTYRLFSEFSDHVRRWCKKYGDHDQSQFMQIFRDFPCFTTPLHGKTPMNLYLQYCTVLMHLYQHREVTSDDLFLTEFAIGNKPDIAPVILKMDQLFGKYYASKNRNDYFDGNMRGKFQFWCEVSNLNDEEQLKTFVKHLTAKLGEHNNQWEQMPHDGVSYNSEIQSQFMRIFGDFPCFIVSSTSKNSVKICRQFCVVLVHLYRHRDVPSSSILAEYAISRTLTWRHIAESVKQQMYPLIGTAMQSAIDDSKSDGSFKIEDINSTVLNKIVDAMQKKMKLDNKEVEFIGSVLRRAHKFAEKSAIWARS